MIDFETRLAYTEIDELLEFLGEEYKSKIPTKLLKFFKDNKLEKYSKEEIQEKIQKRELSLKALTIFASLKIKYLCVDDLEKQILKEIYQSNEKNEVDTIEKEEYNIDNIFKNKIKEEKNVTAKETQLLEYKKESILIKIIYKIKKFLIRKQ